MRGRLLNAHSCLQVMALTYARQTVLDGIKSNRDDYRKTFIRRAVTAQVRP